MGLPLRAGNNPHVLHPVPVKAETKTASMSSPSSTSHAKDQSHKSTETTIATSKAAPSRASKPESRSVASATSGTLKTKEGSVSVAHSSSTTPGRISLRERLARVTAYWAGEGDYYTGRCLSATGVHLHGGHCAVDPSIIPYGSVVEIAGVGTYLAVDTGSAVISRTAAREAGHNSEERSALVIDLFFENRREGEKFAANGPKFASISWSTPASLSNKAKPAHSLLAEEDGSKIQGKQL